MSSSGLSDPWGDFTADPRTPEAAPLRASDRDRDVVSGVLTEAYADGRLTHDEYDERAGATAAAKTLGELPVLIGDLVPHLPVATGRSSVAHDTEAVHARAVRHWESQRRQALVGFLIPTVICWVVFFATGTSFPWPLFVMLGTGGNVLRVLLQRQDIIASEERRLERKQRKALGQPRSSGGEQPGTG